MFKSDKNYKITILFFILIILLTTGLILYTIISPFKFGFCYGESMKPTLQNFEILWGQTPQTINDVSTRDIITFYWEPMNEVVTHRVIDIGNDGTIFAMGDNRQTGEVITLKDVHYVVTGYWVVF